MIQFRRIVTANDVSEVAALAREIWTDHYVSIIGRDQVEYMLENFQSEQAIGEQVRKGYEYYFITEHGSAADCAGSEAEPGGYIALLPDARTASMFVSKIYVLKRLRGRGLGGAAIEFAEARCRASGLHTLWLTVNKNNKGTIAWYEARGFRNMGSVVMDIGDGFVMDDLKMVKRVEEKNSRGEKKSEEGEEEE